MSQDPKEPLAGSGPDDDLPIDAIVNSVVDLNVHATRRVAGARVNVSKRVLVHSADAEIEGWALNVSRGGMRLVLDDTVAIDDVLDVAMSEGEDAPSTPDTPRRSVRVVWIKEDDEGAIVGVEFNDGRSGVSSQRMPTVKPNPHDDVDGLPAPKDPPPV